MKSLFTTLGKFTLLLLMFASANFVNAKSPTYLLKVGNESQPSPTTYEFDVFLLNTSSTTLELQTFQFGLGYDVSILNGGVPSYSIVNVVDGNPSLPAPSELNDTQKPTAFPANNKVSAKTFSISGVDYRYLNCAPRTPPGNGRGTIISNTDRGCSHPGTRIARIRITNSVPFTANSTFKHVWSNAPGTNRTNTIVQAYVNGVAVNITSDASNINYDQEGSCVVKPNGLLINATTTGINTNIDNSSLNSLFAFPNPTSDKTKITFDSDKSAKYSMKVVDLNGRVLIEETISAVAGFNMKEINFENAAKGVYLVSIQAEGKDVKTLRVVVE